MTIYPHATDDGIIELVRKDEHDEVVAELENRVTFFVDANYEIANERNKLRSDNAKLLQRLEDARQSHLHASARNVQTIQQQAVELAKWQSLAVHLAGVLADCKNRAMDKTIELHPDDNAKGCVDDVLEWTESALAAYARDVQTIQQQAVLLDRLAKLVDDASEKADDGDIFRTEWETQARAALAAYESAKKGEQP